MIGYRVWKCQRDGESFKLGSIFHDYIWETSVVKNNLQTDDLLRVDGNYFTHEGRVRSLTNTEEIIPEIGFCAHHTLDGAIEECWEFQEIIGLVSGYGKLHRHSQTFRSEYMQVLAFLWDEQTYDEDITFSWTKTGQWQLGKTREILLQLSSYYNIPVIGKDEMESFNVQPR